MATTDFDSWNLDLHLLRLTAEEREDIPPRKVIHLEEIPDERQHISMMTIIHYLDTPLDLDQVTKGLSSPDMVGVAKEDCSFGGCKSPTERKRKTEATAVTKPKKAMGFGMYSTYEVYWSPPEGTGERRCTVRLFPPKKGETNPDKQRYMLHLTGIKSYDHAYSVSEFVRTLIGDVSTGGVPSVYREETALINNNLNGGYRLRLKVLRDILVEHYGKAAEYKQEGQLKVSINEEPEPGYAKGPVVIVYSTGKFNVNGAKSMDNMNRITSFYFAVLDAYRDVLELQQETAAPKKTK